MMMIRTLMMVMMLRLRGTRVRMMIKGTEIMTAITTTTIMINDGPSQALATTIMTAMATTILMSKAGAGGQVTLFGVHLSSTDARPLSRGDLKRPSKASPFIISVSPSHLARHVPHWVS